MIYQTLVWGSASSLGWDFLLPSFERWASTAARRRDVFAAGDLDDRFAFETSTGTFSAGGGPATTLEE